MDKPVDLRTLEYPRHLHKGPIEYLIVQNATEAADAVKAGWQVHVDPFYVVETPMGPISPEAASVAAVEPVKIEPVKAKPKGKS